MEGQIYETRSRLGEYRRRGEEARDTKAEMGDSVLTSGITT